MKNKLTIQQRLILPIILLGAVALLSNALSVFSIRNVNASASGIVDDNMAGAQILQNIRHSTTDIHKMALSHIVATNYQTMIDVVAQIKEEEKALGALLEEYKGYLMQEEEADYAKLLDNYDCFQHALIDLVCASADSKTEDAYACANSDVARYGQAIAQCADALYTALSERTDNARAKLHGVYMMSLAIAVSTILACIILVFAAVQIIQKYVIRPIKGTVGTLQESSQKLDGVAGGVLKRTRTSGKSAKKFSSLAGSLSGAVREVADHAAIINGSVSHVRADVNDMAQACSAIMDYSSAMKERATEMEALAQQNAQVIRSKTSDILDVLAAAIEDSKSVDQVNSLTKDIVSISSTTNLIALNASIEATRAGEAGKGFAVVANQVKTLAASCSETAERIREVNQVVTNAVYNLSGHSQDMADYLSGTIQGQFQEFVQSGRQYKQDADYIKEMIDAFNSRTDRLRQSMAEIADSIESITKAIDEGASGITGVAGSAKSLVADMSDITRRMDVNREIVEELKKQMEVFADL